ncbi:MAG: EFR1 family ferrodoxin [Oscillospiraceae bacterium]|nr:EFR1 family ferrodoxin [Oscillospiraceae bacterium]
MIFYFSGTGNSLYVAKKLAEGLGSGELYSMAGEPLAGQIGGEGRKVGFVFPSYFGNLPRVVKKFIGEINIHPDTYIFGVVTMGAGLGKGSVSALEKALSANGNTLNYGAGILMPGNYIIKYNPMFLGRAAKADRRIAKISGEINAGKNLIKKNSLTFDNLYNNIALLDESFFVDEKCTGCGECEKICPVSNIILVENKPKWQHHCEHCVACIHWCPSEAIQYGAKTKGRRRYRNPYIGIDELIQQ